MIDRLASERVNCQEVIPHPPPPAHPRGEGFMGSISRRDFLQDSALVAAGLAGIGLIPNSRAAERVAAKKGQINDQLRVAVVGVNSRGMSHVGAFAGNDKLNTVI